MIRNLNKTDFEEFCRVRLNSLEEFPVAYSSMPKFFKQASDDKKMEMLSDSESNSNSFIKAYFEDDKLVGLLGFLQESRESVNHKGSFWGFYVDPDYQNKKIGSQLISASLDDLKNCNSIKHVRLMVATSCESAITVFKNHGFTQYGLEPNSIQDNSIYYDQIYMYCPVKDDRSSNSVSPLCNHE